MRFLLTFLVALFVGYVSAVATQKAVMISFPQDTPQSEVDKAMETLKHAGGYVTHEFSLLKGFAAKASDSALEAVKALGDKYVPFIEEDGIVSIDGSLKEPAKRHAFEA